ncbi:hypothetical protein Patl1_33343 [Pistacia atlantica]|uniref:Uncharacterized protein n=1 Tax=Pistacia atlantica TaxID=434234 RepID=A0ACC0ZUE0_9ROSI|nr:hypothetical protein Patl1_33343 [Pistacia atlantica]
MKVGLYFTGGQPLGQGETILQCLLDFDSCKRNAVEMGFKDALNHHLNELQKPVSIRQMDHV